MNSETKKNVEDKLFHYYKEKSCIERLKRKVSLLEKQIDDTDYQIRNVHKYINLDTDLSASGTGERVQTSRDNTSYFEKEMINQVTKLQREKVNIIKNKIKTENRIKNIELFIGNIGNVIVDLDKKSINYIELKYRDKKSDQYIAIELMTSISSVYRLRDKIIGHLNDLFYAKKK